MKCFKFENSNKSCTQWQYDRQEFVSINTEVSDCGKKYQN